MRVYQFVVPARWCDQRRLVPVGQLMVVSAMGLQQAGGRKAAREIRARGGRAGSVSSFSEPNEDSCNRRVSGGGGTVATSRAADLPVEQAANLEFAVNLKTAKQPYPA